MDQESAETLWDIYHHLVPGLVDFGIRGAECIASLCAAMPIMCGSMSPFMQPAIAASPVVKKCDHTEPIKNIVTMGMLEMGIGDVVSAFPSLCKGCCSGTYMSAVASAEPRWDADNETLEFGLPKFSDFVVSVALKTRDVNYEDFCDSFVMSVAGQNVTEISWKMNIAWARSNNLLPVKCNSTPGFVCTVPLMLTKILPLPLMTMTFHGAAITFKKVKYTGCFALLDLDGVFLDKKTRRFIITREEAGTDSPQALNLIIKNPKTLQWAFEQQRRYLVGIDVLMDFTARLNISNQTIFSEGWCITPNISAEICKHIPVIQSLKVVCGENTVITVYDYSDLIEYNWLKTKTPNPHPGMSWLVPLNRQGMGLSHPECVCGLSVDSVWLDLRFAPCFAGTKIYLELISFGINTMMNTSGLIGVKYEI